MNRRPVFQENVIYKNKRPVHKLGLQIPSNPMQQTRIMDIHICKTSEARCWGVCCSVPGPHYSWRPITHKEQRKIGRQMSMIKKLPATLNNQLLTPELLTTWRSVATSLTFTVAFNLTLLHYRSLSQDAITPLGSALCCLLSTSIVSLGNFIHS